jgi:GntR family transcriptional regulator
MRLNSTSAGARVAAGGQGPLFRRVVEIVRKEILQGVHPVGQRLPTENDLSTRFGVSRQTIREALRELRLAGLVTSRRGSGTTVARQDTAQYYLHETGSLEDLAQYATSTRWDYSTRHEPLEEKLAAQLGVGTSEKWMRLEGCRYAGNEPKPVYWTQAWIHGDYAGVARLLERRTTPIFELMEDLYGVRVDEVEQRVRGRTVPPEVAPLLGLRRSTAVIELSRTYRLADGKVVELSTNLYPIDNFNLGMKLRRRASPP